MAAVSVCVGRVSQHLTTMTQYKASFPYPVIFPPQSMDNVLADWLAKLSLPQYHVAGTRPPLLHLHCHIHTQRHTPHAQTPLPAAPLHTHTYTQRQGGAGPHLTDSVGACGWWGWWLQRRKSMRM
jgi:hypothetical protein